VDAEQFATIFSDVNTFDQTTYSRRTSTLQPTDEHLRVVTITRLTEKSIEKETLYSGEKPEEESIPSD
jgi:hypothetical protein